MRFFTSLPTNILHFPKNPIPLQSLTRRSILQCLFSDLNTSDRFASGSPRTDKAKHAQATEYAPRPDGGIGRRAGLKHQWSNPCRFDPGSGYQTKCKCLIFKHLHFSFSFLHHACTTEWAVLGQNLCFSKNFSVGPLAFADSDTKIIKISS